MGQIEVVRALLASDVPLSAREIAEVNGRIDSTGAFKNTSVAIGRLVKHGEVRRIDDEVTRIPRYELTESARRGYE